MSQSQIRVAAYILLAVGVAGFVIGSSAQQPGLMVAGVVLLVAAAALLVLRRVRR